MSALAAAGDDQVDVLVLLEQDGHEAAVGGVDDLHGRRRQAGLRRPPRAMTWPMARLEWNASLPPRRMQALPLLRHRAAASVVTLGRAS